MSRHIKVGGAYREIHSRYVKVGGVWRTVTEHYRRTAGVYQEVWPLVPGPVTNLTHTFVYRNDRIELDVTWTAPTTGAAVTNYDVNVHISGHTFNHFNTGTTTSFTWALSPSGVGWQSFAGYNVQIILTPQSAGPRDGAQTTNAFQVVPQLPAPPAPGAGSLAMSNYALTSSWGAVTGNRISQYRLFVSFDTGNYEYIVNKASTSAGHWPWDVNTVAGGSVNVWVRAEGPGGVSAYTFLGGGSLPTMPSLATARFWSGSGDGGDPGGRFIHDVNCPGGANVWWQNVSTGGAWNFIGIHNGSGRVILSGSEAWARDNATYYRFIYQPLNQTLGWTGRAVGSNYALKAPNPHFVGPTYSETWYSERGWFGLPIKQGSSTAGQRTGCWFYGSGMYDTLNAPRLGYYVTVYRSDIFLARLTTGGPGGGIPVRLWLHTDQNRPGGNVSLAGGVDIAIMARGDSGFYQMPAGWGNQLKDGSYWGTALHHQNTAINGAIGTSNEYGEFRGHNESAFGLPWGTVAMYHDG